MTGRYAIRSGNGTVPLGEGVYGLVSGRSRWPRCSRTPATRPGMFGKWHLGRTEGRFPTDQGFDEWYGVPNSTDESVYTSLPGFAESGVEETYVMEGTQGRGAAKKVRPYRLDYRPLIDRDLTDKAIDFMRRQAGRDAVLRLPALHGHALPDAAAPRLRRADGQRAVGRSARRSTRTRPAARRRRRAGRRRRHDLHLHRRQRPGGARRSGVGTTTSRRDGLHGSAGPWRGTLFTGFEGALRVPFVDPLAGNDRGRCGERRDRARDGPVPDPGEARGRRRARRIAPIDGIDVSDFLLGEREKSGGTDSSSTWATTCSA